MHVENYYADRDTLRSLFSLADDSQAQIDSYISLGEVLVVRDCDNSIVGHLQLLETSGAGVFELKSVAVCENRRREGIGRKLIEAAADWCRQRNGHRLIVSTATADIGNLRFYQRLGFRMYQIVQDAFGP